MEPTLLIAGNGYLGQAVAEQSKELNEKTITLSKSGEGADHGLDFTNLAELHALSLTIPPPSHILASASSGRGGIDAYRNIFLRGTENLLQTFPEAQLTFISSTSVYRESDGATVTEETPQTGTTEKSAILLQAESLALQAGGTALRLSGIYGPHRSVILRKYLNDEATLEETPLAGSFSANSANCCSSLGIRILNQIHRDDAARAILHLIQSAQTGLYNVSDNEPTSQLDTYQALGEKFAKPLPPIAPPNPNSKRGWTHKAVSNAKLRATGWAPQYASFLSAIDDLVAAQID